MVTADHTLFAEYDSEGGADDVDAETKSLLVQVVQ